MQEYYARRDRVVSTVYGYYYGMPGTIIGPAQVQYGNGIRLIVELDAGKRIVLSENHIKHINE